MVKKMRMITARRLEVLCDRTDYIKGGYTLANNALIETYVNYKLAKNSFPFKYKYLIFLKNLVSKNLHLAVFRKYFEVWPYHYNIVPFFKFLKNIYLKDTVFYSTLFKDVKNSLSINKKIFKHKNLKYGYTKLFKTGFVGGENYIIIPKDWNKNKNYFDVVETHKKYTLYKESVFFKNYVIFNKYNPSIEFFILNFYFILYLSFLVEIYSDLNLLLFVIYKYI